MLPVSGALHSNTVFHAALLQYARPLMTYVGCKQVYRQIGDKSYDTES